MDLTLDQAKQFFEANKDDQAVKDYLKTFEKSAELTDTAVMAYLETEAGKRLLQPVHDRYTNKAIETYKEKTLPGLVEAEVAKRNPKETEEQKQIRELREEIKKKEIEQNKKDQKSFALRLAAEKGLRVDLIDDINLGETDEETRAIVDRIASKDAEHVKTLVDAQVAERLKGTPPAGGLPAPTEPAKLQEAQDKALADAHKGTRGAFAAAVKIEDQKYAAGQKK